MTTVSPARRSDSPLLALRKERGLSREELAADAGLSPRTIYAIEVEGVRPQRATRRVLALALGVDPGSLAPNDERPPGVAGAVQESAGQGRHAEP